MLLVPVYFLTANNDPFSKPALNYLLEVEDFFGCVFEKLKLDLVFLGFSISDFERILPSL